jgi:hypothetical protein
VASRRRRARRRFYLLGPSVMCRTAMKMLADYDYKNACRPAVMHSASQITEIFHVFLKSSQVIENKRLNFYESRFIVELP